MGCIRLFFAEVFESSQTLQMLLLPRCEALLCVGDGGHCPRSGAPLWLHQKSGSQEHARLTARRMGEQNWGSK